MISHSLTPQFWFQQFPPVPPEQHSGGSLPSLKKGGFLGPATWPADDAGKWRTPAFADDIGGKPRGDFHVTSYEFDNHWRYALMNLKIMEWNCRNLFDISWQTWKFINFPCLYSSFVDVLWQRFRLQTPQKKERFRTTTQAQHDPSCQSAKFPWGSPDCRKLAGIFIIYKTWRATAMRKNGKHQRCESAWSFS